MHPHLPDIQGHCLGQVSLGKVMYAVYDAPHDGSCFYHAYSMMVSTIVYIMVTCKLDCYHWITLLSVLIFFTKFSLGL